MIEVIKKVLLFDDHQDSEHERAISTTTLIGPAWKARRAMLKDGVKKTSPDPMMKRSSALGTGFHMRAEQALKDDPKVDAMEVFAERYIEKYDVWISGKFDLVYDGYIMDHKTSYGKAFNEEKLHKTMLQESIYRWLNPDIPMKDTGYALFVSQSNNAYDSYPFELMTIEETEVYIMMQLDTIFETKTINCNDGVKFNMCNYCDLDESQCKILELTNSGTF